MLHRGASLSAAMACCLVGFGCASSTSSALSPTAPPAPPAAAAAPTGNRLEAALAADMGPDSAMPWSERRPLEWPDFIGPPPQPDAREAARTTTVLYYAWRCHGSATESFEFAALAGFVPRSSWVRRGIPADTLNSSRVLRHEQTHFDLAEVYARRLRRRFSGVSRPCAQSDADLKSLAAEVVREEASAQRLYDAETDHSLIAARQAEWEQQVASQLAALNRYASPVVRGGSSR